MLTLIESRRRRQRTVGGTATSVLVHAALISCAVYVTAQAKEIPVYGPREGPIPLQPFSEPTPKKHDTGSHGTAREPGTPTLPMRRSIDFTIPDSLPPIDSARDIATASGADTALFGTHDDHDRGGGATDGPPFIASRVDEPAMARDGNPAPRYPSVLEQSAVEGEVLAQFVVDTTGRAEMSTFEIVRSTNELFAAALRDAVRRWRFFPAQTGGRKVRQIVQIPVRFVAPRSR